MAQATSIKEQRPTGRTVLESGKHWTLTCCELQLARQPDSREDIG